MLLTTDIPTDAQRAAAHAALPWTDDAFKLAGIVRGSLDNQAVELIEEALGPPHARAAVVRATPKCRCFARATRWQGGRWQFNFPPPANQPQPTIDERFEMVSDAAAATLVYAEASWEVAKKWMRGLGVWVTAADGDVRVQAGIGVIQPRETRDPGPFFVAA